VLIEHSDFPFQDQRVEVGNNAIATASSRNQPVKATGRNLYATAPEHAEATSS